MQQQSNPTQSTDDLDQRLIAIQQRAVGIARPDADIDRIVSALDQLADGGASDAALDAIEHSAAHLISSLETAQAQLATALEIASTIKAQRDATRQALKDLRSALDRVDTDNPAIADLVECVEAEAWDIVYESMWEEVATRIWDSSGLDITEAHRLLDILTDGSIDADNPLWDEVRDWMRHIEEQYHV